MTDLLGPASQNAVTTRPTEYRSIGSVDTFFKPCTDQTSQDGTFIAAAWLNAIMMQVRRAIDGMGIARNNSDDDMLLKAIQAAQLNIFIRSSVIWGVGPGPVNMFANLPAALAYLADKIIVAPAVVTLQLDAGVHVLAAPITLDHPNGDRIVIAGATLLAAAPASTAFACTGSGSASRSADKTTNIAMLRTRFATELRFTGDGLTMAGGSTLGLLKNLLITGANTGFGLTVYGAASLIFDTVALALFRANVNMSFGAVTSGNNLYSMGSASNGISVASTASMHVTGNLVATQSEDSGIVITDESSVACEFGTGIFIGGCATHGAVAFKNANMFMPGIRVVYCVGNGVNCSDAATAKIDGGSGSNCTAGLIYAIYAGEVTASTFTSNNETPADFSAYYGSFIHAIGYTSPGATFSPAKNTGGNGNSYIAG